MSDGETVKFCCPANQYYSKDEHMTDTLEISPRVIKCKKPLKLDETYEQMLSIKNIGMFPRSITYFTDSLEDTTLTALNLKPYEYLKPSATLDLLVRVRPLSKKSIKVNRHIFLDFKHPNLRIEIPVIAFQKFNISYVPTDIELPSTVPKSFTYYEFILYNGETTSCRFTIRTLNQCLTAKAESLKIDARDFVRVILKLNAQNESIAMGSMKLHFGNSPLKINYIHQPKLSSSLYLSTTYIRFEETKFNREVKKKFTVCNNTQYSIPFSFDFDSKLQCFNNNNGSSTDSEYSTFEDGRHSNYDLGNEVDQPQRDQDRVYDDIISKTFTIEPQEGQFPPKASIEFTITFHPLFDNHEYSITDELPFPANTKILLSSHVEGIDVNACIVLDATIDGPEMYITPKSIDFRKVYLGEEHCEQIRITNIDGIIKCEVKFMGYTSPEMAKAYISPKQKVLEPCETGLFTFTFFSLLVGKIFFKLRFKIQNGTFIYVTVRANSVPVRVKTFPDVVELGTVPFGVPQKRSVLLMNPLSVPISMQCFTEDNGSETPLVLNVDEINDLPPITIKNPLDYILGALAEDTISAYHDYDQSERRGSESGQYCSASSSEYLNVCSRKFQTEVLDKLPQLANETIAQLKAKRIIEKHEPEAKVITEVTDKLLNLSYFEEFRRYNNYARMNWDAIPSDPIEIYFDSEIISLTPNASHTLTFLVIPNSVGYFNRAIGLRCLPHRHTIPDDEDDSLGVIVDSQLMETKMWIEYNCKIPQISWNKEINLKDQAIYAMSNTNFDIEFKNESCVGGFVHFVIVPFCRSGVMRFRNDTWKFFIPALETQVAECQVEFREIGDVTLTGIVKIVGSCTGIPFHINAYVLPAKITIAPKAINRRQKVLETTVEYVYIHNVTPTTTGLLFYLRSDRHQKIDPSGAQLSPTGQGMYISITSTYPDPEIYKNTLTIDLLYGYKEEIPLTYTVTGVPIHFDPDITKGHDIGTLLISAEKELACDNLNYSRKIRVWNEGERPYVITFHRIKAFKNSGSCTIQNVKAQIYIEPKMIRLEPGEEKSINICASSCEQVKLSSEFRANIVDQINPMRVLSQTFEITAKFTPVEFKWSRLEIRMVYNRTHKLKQHPQLEIVELINVTGASIDDVYVKVCGPFKIKSLYENPYSKDLELSFSPNESKEITIMLDEKRVRKETVSFLKGRVYCYANDRPQKTISLRVDIHYPDILIVHSEIVIFTDDQERDTSIVLENVGDLDAQFKWKKLGECTKYVDKFDHYKSYAADMLYDLLRMLELHDEDEESLDSICMRNASLCYQKYRCKLGELNDPNNISDIVLDIIDKIDYEHRRYKITFSDDEDDDDKSQKSDASSRTVVHDTLEKIWEKLKLEDSYEISEPSLDECNKEEHFYFYEKSGVVEGKHGAYSMLHLPGVSKGYAHMAKFLLDVVGGHPHKLTITLANLEKIVQVVPENIYLGVHPWYELFKAKIRVENITQFKLNITANDMPRPKVENYHHKHLINGYACILGSRIFILNSYGRHCIRSEGILGFSSEFLRDFVLVINEHSSSTFRLRGQGVMPIFLATRRNLVRTPQSEDETIEEYKLLQRIFYLNMFKDIIILDEESDVPLGEEECDSKTDIISYSQISVLYSSECSDTPHDTTCDERILRNWDLLLSTYVFVNNNESVPHPSVLEQLINMEKFIDDLKCNSAKRNLLQHIYRNYKEVEGKRDRNMPINLKYFTVQPLPFEQWGYVIDMPNLKLGQFRSYYIDLQFLGPGKLIAAARTAVKVPGLYVYFSVKSSSDKDFIYYRSEDKMPDFFKKRYRNMWEREIDQETNPKLLHAHSYDCEDRCKYHKREISNKTLRDRRDVKNYYNSLNKSVYLENKHHFINCMMYDNAKENNSGTIVRVNIIIKTDSKFYAEGQVIEDYLYVDLHMGPILPILMRGLVR